MGGGSGRRKDSPCFVAETIVRDLSEISRGGGGVGILNLRSEIR